MYYHASQTSGIETLEPRVSNHGVALVYFSKKRENVLVYLSNSIEKYCRETGFAFEGPCRKWGPYGFDKDGLQRIEEYYPGALESTYRGVSGYIYSAECIDEYEFDLRIPDAAVSNVPVRVSGAEFVEDAYEAILKAEKEGLIRILRFEELSGDKLEWIDRVIKEEYQSSSDHPEYRHFLKGNFPGILEGI